MAIGDTGPLEHPLQRFFTCARPQPTFQWERYQLRDVLVINHPQCQAVFSRQGGQLLHFQPTGQKPWLWCASQWPQVGAIRGGVPVCWPWVGRHPGEGGWPANGWGRLLDWKLIESQERDEGVSLHWRLSLWDWQADLYAELGQGMDLRLETQHEDSEPCQFGHALHAYWRISDIADVALEGLDGAQGYDGISRSACEQKGELRRSGQLSEGLRSCRSAGIAGCRLAATLEHRHARQPQYRDLASGESAIAGRGRQRSDGFSAG
jgi:D-hexose-6-phosphate mutarotase